MNVIVTIEDREAIPVRAIPLLTDWKKISPDFVARIFAGDEKLFLHLPAFESLCAYQLNSNGSYVATEKRAWESWVLRSLNACSTRIKEAQTNHEVGYQQWRQESWALLPSGVFVWRDEFEAAYQSEYGPDSLRALANRESYDAKAYALNFSPEPWGLREDWREVLMEGFAQVIVSIGLRRADGVADEELTQGREDTFVRAPTLDDTEAKEEEVPFKRAALIGKHSCEWPTIERDIADANKNGLADAAKAGQRGWVESRALNWARAKGKLKSSEKYGYSVDQAIRNMHAPVSARNRLQD